MQRLEASDAKAGRVQLFAGAVLGMPPWILGSRTHPEDSGMHRLP